MNESVSLALTWAVGVMLGAMFFGGLWWTIQNGLPSKNPALWFFGSTLLRLSAALAGFYFIAGKDWRKLLICMLGFLIARLLVTRLTRTPREGIDAP